MLYIFQDDLHWPQSLDLLQWQVVLDDGQLQFLTIGLPDILQYVQAGHEIWLILSSQIASIHHVSLPKVSRKDILPAIASILEDQLTQEFSHLHCFYQIQEQKKTTSKYEVVLIDRHHFQQSLLKWQSLKVPVMGVTLDWFALQSNQVVCLENGDAIANSEIFQGFVPKSLLQTQRFKLAQGTDFYSQQPIPDTPYHPINTSVPQWLVHRLKTQGLVDISMRPKSFQHLEWMQKKRIESLFIKCSVGLLAVSILGFMGFFVKNVLNYTHNKHIIQSFSQQPTDDLELKLATYQRHQVVKNKFWGLFISLQKASLPGIVVKHFDYSQEHLKLVVEASDTRIFQMFKKHLMQAHIRVEQSQVLVQQNSIKANLDLRSF